MVRWSCCSGFERDDLKHKKHNKISYTHVSVPDPSRALRLNLTPYDASATELQGDCQLSTLGAMVPKNFLEHVTQTLFVFAKNTLLFIDPIVVGGG